MLFLVLEVVFGLLVENVGSLGLEAVAETDPLLAGIGILEDGDEVYADDDLALVEEEDAVLVVLVGPDGVLDGSDVLDAEEVFGGNMPALDVAH